MPEIQLEDVRARQMNPPIRALHFIAELGVFVAIYEAAEKSKQDQKSMGQK